jgi:hypothetical protein
MTGPVIRLYHGTNVEAARKIMDEGFLPVDPLSAVRALADQFGVPDSVWRDEFFVHAQHRYRFHDVSFTTGWGDAASYARRAGGEAAWYALCAIGRHLHGVEHDTAESCGWVEAQASGTPAVLTIEAVVADVTARAADGVELAVERLLPPAEDTIAWKLDVAEEVRLAAPVPAAWLVAVEQLGPCVCRGQLRRLERCALCPAPLDRSPVT